MSNHCEIFLFPELNKFVFFNASLNTENEELRIPKSFSNYLEYQQSFFNALFIFTSLLLFFIFLHSSIVSKTDGTTGPVFALFANGEVQMVAFTGLLKDKLTFKGNTWGKMPAR